jgi:hypothetical protein
MIRSKYQYRVAGKSSQEAIANIQKHLEARVDILRLAESKRFGFRGDQNDIHMTTPGVSFRNDPRRYFNSINNEGTALGCAFATQLTYYAGVGKWKQDTARRTLTGIDDIVPGDWAYFYNDADTTNSHREMYPKDRDWLDPNWRPGFEGENVIYAGKDWFWGLFNQSQIVKSWQE